MSYQIAMEGFLIVGTLALAAEVVVYARQRLKRIDRGIRLVNFMVDRVNAHVEGEIVSMRQNDSGEAAWPFH